MQKRVAFYHLSKRKYLLFPYENSSKKKLAMEKTSLFIYGQTTVCLFLSPNHFDLSYRLQTQNHPRSLARAYEFGAIHN
jgi:hypothetical protein